MLDKHYDHKKVESGKYEKWVKGGYFTAGDNSKPAFSMVIPPPNVTGKLHLGHVIDTTNQDIICRYKRMKGYDVLWLPGMDHAGIATQAKVEEKLRRQGLNRYELGREKFLEKVWEWKDEYAKTIHTQWASLGLSVDYTRERFTLDEGLNEAVKHVFVTLYNEGLIYQGEKIINWDPVLKTALSNIEVVHKEDKGQFYYFKYDVVGTDEHLIVATTRPETMFGDTAVFVNPKDKRYKHLVGKKVINPANGEEIPLMADPYVDLEFGTGAMKCTPAHDPNDFMLGKKYGFQFIKCLDEEAKMNEKAGKYCGLDRYECRKQLVEDIKKNGHLDHIEDIVHEVGHSERSDAVVEPMLSKQWFVKMKPLAERVIENQKTDNKVNFVPSRFENVLLNWMNDVDDWCISRQLWWGHRIPAYYNNETGEVLVSETEPDMSKYHQDEDVLDTWFSSGLWPFATMGWPNGEKDYSRYFPTSCLVTGYDIIFFWVSRMIFQSLHFTNNIPFKDVVIHGLVRDSQGKKMSKSLNNGVDPIDVIEKYGVDALRYFITTNCTPGQDMRYIEEKVASSESYLNKIWNATRYVEGVLGDDFIPSKIDKSKLSVLDASILSKLQKVIASMGKSMDEYQFGTASSILFDFVYDDFCSNYLEFSKISLSKNDEGSLVTKNVLYKVMRSIILMIYPYAPFVGEELYLSLPMHLDSVCLESYPSVEKEFINKEAETKEGALEEMIKDIRNYKSENSLAPNAKVRLLISPKEPFEGSSEYLARFSFASSIAITKDKLDGQTFIYDGFEMSIEEDVDRDVLLAKLKEEKARLEGEIARTTKMLSNPGFVSKAPTAKVEEEREKDRINKEKLKTVEEKLASFN
ncbi:MAG: valine--tRNA ligase [Bacilli bacterium]|nr:valine--tRNA ligase [Bacilli bacterium]